MMPLDGWGISLDTMMQEEIRLEKESVRPVGAIRKRIRDLRAARRRIVFISDMYLPSQVIREMLLANKLADDKDPVYVSGEIGLTKRSGRLFAHVREREQVEWQDWTHVGDDETSDISRPRQLGIGVEPFYGARLSRFESNLAVQPFEHPATASRLAGISRAARLSVEVPPAFPGDVVGVATGVAGPLLLAFNEWVLRGAASASINRLYFVASDGQILKKIADRLCQDRAGIECRYLHGSRQSWFLPSLRQASRQQLEWLMPAYHSTAPRILLEKLELEPEHWRPLLLSHGFSETDWDRELPEDRREDFWSLLTDPRMAAAIEARAADARRRAIAYFQQEGMIGTQNWAIVDAGWTLNSQYALLNILRYEDNSTEIFGYYMGLRHDRIVDGRAGGARSFLMWDCDAAHPDSRELLRHFIVSEKAFMIADHETTIAYEYGATGAAPVLEKKTNSACRDFARTWQELIVAYADEWCRAKMSETPIHELKFACLSGLRAFLCCPMREEAEAVAWLPVSTEQNDRDLHPLARPLQWRETMRLARGLPINQHDRGRTWAEGALAISSRGTKLAFRAMLACRKLVLISCQLWSSATSKRKIGP
jgi:hypothetical protein